MEQQNEHETPTQSQQDLFNRQVAALAHHIVGLMIVAQVPPIVVSLAASQIIRAVIMDLQQHQPEVAKALLEEMANGLVELMNDIGVKPGETKQ